METLLFHWLTSFVPFEFLFNTFAWNKTNHKFPTFETLKIYYHEMPTPIVVFGDLSYSTMIFINAFYFYQKLNINNFFALLALIVCTQIIYDFIFFLFITYSNMDKTNDYILFFKKYSNDFSYRAIIADSIYLIIWFLFTMISMKYCSKLFQYYLIALGIFLLVIFSFEDL